MARERGPSRSGRRARAKAFYDSYMSSPAWWRFRREWYRWAKAAGEVCCTGCGKQWTLNDDLHHITYARLTKENYHDLWPLCRGCHEFVHAIIDRPGWRKVGRVQAHRAALGALRQRRARSETGE